jgi:hypothetical protein
LSSSLTSRGFNGGSMSLTSTCLTPTSSISEFSSATTRLSRSQARVIACCGVPALHTYLREPPHGTLTVTSYPVPTVFTVLYVLFSVFLLIWSVSLLVRRPLDLRNMADRASARSSRLNGILQVTACCTAPAVSHEVIAFRARWPRPVIRAATRYAGIAGRREWLLKASACHGGGVQRL